LGYYYITFGVSDGKLGDSERILIYVKGENGDNDGENKYGIEVTLNAERKTDKSWTSKKDYGKIAFNIIKGSTKISKIILYKKTPGGMFKAIQEFGYRGEESVSTVDTYLESGINYIYKIMIVDDKNCIIARSNEVSI
jgi:hypothetical protein